MGIFLGGFIAPFSVVIVGFGGGILLFFVFKLFYYSTLFSVRFRFELIS